MNSDCLRAFWRQTLVLSDWAPTGQVCGLIGVEQSLKDEGDSLFADHFRRLAAFR